MNRLDEKILIAEICSRLDASVAGLEPAIIARLENMRHTALDTDRSTSMLDIDANLALHVSQTLDSDSDISPMISARLDDARRNAIAQMSSRQGEPSYRERLAALLNSFLLARPASMFATACVLVTVVSLFYVTSRPAGSLPLEDEIGLIASAEDFELYENLDFYLWLAENGSLN